MLIRNIPSLVEPQIVATDVERLATTLFRLDSMLGYIDNKFGYLVFTSLARRNSLVNPHASCLAKLPT